MVAIILYLIIMSIILAPGRLRQETTSLPQKTPQNKRTPKAKHSDAGSQAWPAAMLLVLYDCMMSTSSHATGYRQTPPFWICASYKESLTRCLHCAPLKLRCAPLCPSTKCAHFLFSTLRSPRAWLVSVATEDSSSHHGHSLRGHLRVDDREDLDSHLRPSSSLDT